MFYKNSRAKDGAQSYCKKCATKRRIQRYIENKEHEVSLRKKREKELFEWFFEYRKTLKCCECKEGRWWVLDFHHLDSDKKDYNISNMIRKNSKRRILEEIDKCKVVCANCHRDLHFKG